MFACVLLIGAASERREICSIENLTYITSTDAAILLARVVVEVARELRALIASCVEASWALGHFH